MDQNENQKKVDEILEKLSQDWTLTPKLIKLKLKEELQQCFAGLFFILKIVKQNIYSYFQGKLYFIPKKSAINSQIASFQSEYTRNLEKTIVLPEFAKIGEQWFFQSHKQCIIDGQVESFLVWGVTPLI